MTDPVIIAPTLRDDLSRYEMVGWSWAGGVYMDPKFHGTAWVYADECGECAAEFGE